MLSYGDYRAFDDKLDRILAGLETIQTQHRAVIAGLTTVSTQGAAIMASFEELTQVVTDLAAAVQPLAGAIDALEAAVTAAKGTLTAEQQTALDSAVSGLRAIGTDIAAAVADAGDSTDEGATPAEPTA